MCQFKPQKRSQSVCDDAAVSVAATGIDNGVGKAAPATLMTTTTAVVATAALVYLFAKLDTFSFFHNAAYLRDTHTHTLTNYLYTHTHTHLQRERERRCGRERATQHAHRASEAVRERRSRRLVCTATSQAKLNGPR